MNLAGSAHRTARAALERGFELTSVVPLAGFAVLHLGNYARALFGATEVGGRHALSAWAIGVEAVCVWLPLAFHVALAGPVWLRRRAQPAEPARAGGLTLHRLAGALLAPFVVDHFVRFRWPILRGDRYPAESVLALARELSSTVGGFPLLAAWHALGTLALSYHLGYGLARVAERHAPSAVVGRLRALSFALGALAAVFGTLTIVRLATG